MKLLLLGSTGLLGPAIRAEAAARSNEVVGASRSGADIALDISDDVELGNVLGAADPDAVINCAALTDIGQCEADPGLAYRVNARPLSLLASWSTMKKRPIVHISTDHVFTDGGPRPHAESDPVSLVNEYARTKFAGEAFALTSPHALVIRTAIVGIRSWARQTLAEWAIAAIESGEAVTLFDDAFTSCIDVGACAKACLDLLKRGANGLINVASHQVFTKGDLIRELARQMGRELNAAPAASVHDLQPPRAACLGLDVRAAERRLGYELPSLQAVVAAVLNQYEGAARA